MGWVGLARPGQVRLLYIVKEVVEWCTESPSVKFGFYKSQILSLETTNFDSHVIVVRIVAWFWLNRKVETKNTIKQNQDKMQWYTKIDPSIQDVNELNATFEKNHFCQNWRGNKQS